ncbi:hypothetical protein MLD38_005806 [Melastoma candidum]|uniref:Uncharacterized protein n=1 Tax=Melastoma candidum TaxID=119954 RepID=A0ACB9RKX9_9MYRT|nr:hypothetical protein MLD38_005806 [Melastoma candidum]
MRKELLTSSEEFRVTSPLRMAAGHSPVVNPRLKREDCQRTKHDSAFSPWKILVGASDWEDHSSGKEGAERYRTQNLPAVARPGLYELGVADSRIISGRNIDLRSVVVAYLGQADCVRTRLQQYGRSGAHLGKFVPNDCQGSSKDKQSVAGLFELILSRGCNIVFRWAPMLSKADAERMEFLLLKTFDYAWNKGANGARRPDDVFRKLDEVSSRGHSLSSFAKKLLHISPKKVGVKIKGEPHADEKDLNMAIKMKREPHLDEKDPISSYHDGHGSSFRGIVKLTRSRPTPLNSSESADSDTICGIELTNGLICRNSPAEGRKRCPHHKGMKVSVRQQLTVPSERVYGSDELSSYDYQLTHSAASDNCPAGSSSSLICGVILGDGSSCLKSPVLGRKRCSEHKGMRVWNTEDLAQTTGTYMMNGGGNEGAMCGVNRGDGNICMEKPARGRVRCKDHKGMRADHGR